jgi:hypothetical protein
MLLAVLAFTAAVGQAKVEPGWKYEASVVFHNPGAVPLELYWWQVDQDGE